MMSSKPAATSTWPDPDVVRSLVTVNDVEFVTVNVPDTPKVELKTGAVVALLTVNVPAIVEAVPTANAAACDDDTVKVPEVKVNAPVTFTRPVPLICFVPELPIVSAAIDAAAAPPENVNPPEPDVCRRVDTVNVA